MDEFFFNAETQRRRDSQSGGDVSDKNVANVQEALIKSAKAKVKLNDFGGAINDYEKVLKLKDDKQKKTFSHYVTAIQELSTIYSNRLNDFPGAIALVEKAEKTPKAEKAPKLHQA